MLRCMLLSSTYLRFKPSQVAAAAIILSLNINSSQISRLMGAPSVLTEVHTQAFYYAEGFSQQEELKDNANGPLARWNDRVRSVTKLSAYEDIQQCYEVMTLLVNNTEEVNG